MVLGMLVLSHVKRTSQEADKSRSKLPVTVKEFPKIHQNGHLGEASKTFQMPNREWCLEKESASGLRVREGNSIKTTQKCYGIYV